MNFRSFLSPTFSKGAFLAFLVVATSARAQTARDARTTTVRPTKTKITPLTNDSSANTNTMSSTVGFITANCLANSDTYLNIPFTRPPVYVGVAASGATTGSTGTISFSDSPFAAGVYKYVQGTQSNHYYAYVAGGVKEGSIYDIADNTANTLTINTNGDDISALASGTPVRIVPHWTLATALTVGQAVIGSPSFGGVAPTQILIPDQSTPGTDLVPGSTYYYYMGAAQGGPGWRRLGSGGAIVNDTILYPETFFILRNNTASAVSFMPLGSVSTLGTAVTSGGIQTVGVNIPTVLNTLQANTDQDNAVALAVPVDTTLSGSSLYESGAFAGTASFGGGSGDQLLMFDNTVVGTDKVPAKTYYYYTGVQSLGPGWRLLGGGAAMHNGDPLVAGTGFVIRKRATTTPQTAVWNYRPVIAP